MTPICMVTLNLFEFGDENHTIIHCLYNSNNLSTANGNFHIPVQLITDHESNQLLRELQDDGVVSPGEWTDANRTRPYTGIISSNNSKIEKDL